MLRMLNSQFSSIKEPMMIVLSHYTHIVLSHLITVILSHNKNKAFKELNTACQTSVVLQMK